MGVGNSFASSTRGAELLIQFCPSLNLAKFPIDLIKAKFLRYDESRGEPLAGPGGVAPPEGKAPVARASTSNTTMIPCITTRDNQLAFIKDSIDIIQRRYPEQFRTLPIDTYVEMCMRKLINDRAVTGNIHIDWEACFPLYGFLEKQGAIIKSWKRRVFMFDMERQSVCYYQLGKTKSSNKLKGEIKILVDTVAEIFDVDNKSSFLYKQRAGVFKGKTKGCGFTVGPPQTGAYDQSRTYYLISDHPEATKRWVRAFQEFTRFLSRDASGGKRHMTIAQERTHKPEKVAEGKEAPVKPLALDANLYGPQSASDETPGSPAAAGSSAASSSSTAAAASSSPSSSSSSTAATSTAVSTSPPSSPATAARGGASATGGSSSPSGSSSSSGGATVAVAVGVTSSASGATAASSSSSSSSTSGNPYAELRFFSADPAQWTAVTPATSTPTSSSPSSTLNPFASIPFFSADVQQWQTPLPATHAR